MTTIGITVACRPDGWTRALGGISTARCSLSSVRSWMTGMLYHSSHHFSPISRNTHQFKTFQVQFECAFLGEESKKLSSTARGHKLRTATRDNHHPWEDILESLFTQTRFGTGTGALIISTHCIVVILKESRDSSDLRSQPNSNMRESRGTGLKRSKSSFRWSEGRNHPFEGTPSPQYERNIAQSIPVLYFSLTQGYVRGQGYPVIREKLHQD